MIQFLPPHKEIHVRVIAQGVKMRTWDMVDWDMRVIPCAVASLDAHAQIQLIHAVEAAELLDPTTAVRCVND